MTILITGGAGFIGSHLCEKLLSEGNQVICIDDLSTGSKENIEKLLENDRFVFMEHDILTPLKINGEIDQIYNLACPASPKHYQKDAVRTIRINTEGILHLLNLAKEHNARFFHTSTSEVYGDPKEHPQKETYWGNVNPNGPRSCYDEGKRVAESLIVSFANQNNIEYRLIRIFNTYGPNMDPEDGRVVSNFIVQALEGKDITIYGDGSQTRSFCYVDDLVEGIVKLMNNPKYTGPINMGNPTEFTIKELAEKVIQRINTKSKIVYKDLPQDDPTKRKPDISEAKNRIGWEPQIPLDHGLEKTIKYFTKILNK